MNREAGTKTWDRGSPSHCAMRFFSPALAVSGRINAGKISQARDRLTYLEHGTVTDQIAEQVPFFPSRIGLVLVEVDGEDILLGLGWSGLVTWRWLWLEQIIWLTTRA